MLEPTVTIPRSRAVVMRLALITAAVMACLAVTDVVVRLVLPAETPFLQKTIDIQTPEMLALKLGQLQRFDGAKIVVLGDSVVYGRTMHEKGDENWEQHTLSAQLKAELERINPDRELMVLNLGMNGALPSDLEHLIRILMPLRPDLIVFDLTLRSFSRDFESEDEQNTRPWLAGFSMKENGTFTTQEGWLANIAANYWYLYRLRDTLQALLFNGKPADWFTQKREQIDARFLGQTPVPADEFILLMKVRKRYDAIDLAADNPQRQGLERTLMHLKTANQPAIAFYATEDATKISDLIEEEKFEVLQKDLRMIMSDEDDHLQWLGPLDIYEPENYLDYVHLNADGYGRLAKRLAPLAEKALKEK